LTPGYHQLAVSPESLEKLAFQGVVAIERTIPLCLSDLPTGQQLSSISSMTLTAFGRSLPNRTAYRSTTISTPILLSRTS
jgi:hypothetical protein